MEKHGPNLYEDNALDSLFGKDAGKLKPGMHDGHSLTKGVNFLKRVFSSVCILSLSVI